MDEKFLITGLSSIKIISFTAKQKSSQAGMYNFLLNDSDLNIPVALSKFHLQQAGFPWHSDERHQ